MTKHYDQSYFDTWYRQRGIGDSARLARKVAMAVATAEYHLERPLRTVLDIGCGEGVWRAPLLKLRPKARYLGFDSSEYAVRRFGARRNLHRASFADFALLRPCAPVDLLVCSDVMHYLDTRELDRGLPGLAELCGEHDFRNRPAKFYRERFGKLGFTQVGSHLWLSPALRHHATALETQ